MKSFAGIAIVLLAAVATLLLLPGPSASQARVTAITDVRLFDGEQVIEQATVLLIDGRVAEAGRGVAIPADAERLDGRGRTVLPGLIDAHVHSFGSARTDALRAGVTTTLDMFASPANFERSHQERASLARTDRADLFSAGFLATAEGGHGTQYGIPVPIPESPETAGDWVQARLEEGSDYIKIVIEDGSTWNRPLPTLDPSMVRALVDAAHARDVPAVAHVSTLAGARMAIDAGIDGLVHLFADQPVDPEFVERARSAGVWIAPTATVLAAAHGQTVPDWLIDHPLASPDQRASLGRGFPGAALRQARWPVVYANIRALHEAGLTLLAGSDAGNAGTAHGLSLHHELWMLVEAGLSPIEALRAATSDTADEFGLSGRGCLRAGCRADALLVEGNPFDEIRRTLRIERVWKNGHEVDLTLPEPDLADAAPAVKFDGPLDLLADRARWMSAADRFMGGQSESRLEWSDSGLALSGQLRDGFAFPYAGGMWNTSEIPMQPRNLNAYRGLSIRIEGPAEHYQLLFFSGTSAETAPAMIEVEPGRSRRIEFDEVPGFDPATTRAIGVFQVGTPGEFEFSVEAAQLQ